VYTCRPIRTYQFNMTPTSHEAQIEFYHFSEARLMYSKLVKSPKYASLQDLLLLFEIFKELQGKIICPHYVPPRGGLEFPASIHFGVRISTLVSRYCCSCRSLPSKSISALSFRGSVLVSLTAVLVSVGQWFPNSCGWRRT
jgi:hypothetical protein